MPIATADDWFAAAKQAISLQKQSFTTVANQPFSLLDVAGAPGAGSLAVGNTTTGLVPTDVLAGCPVITAFGAGGAVGYLAKGRFRNSVAGGLDLYDRLWHAGSVALTVLATTTFAAQPSYLARIPDYSNLEILLEINAAVSATATTVAVTYTNEAGVAGRSTGASVSLSGLTSRRVVAMPLQAGDKGVRQIDSVVVGGTVAGTGSFNVIVARRLASFDVRLPNGQDVQPWDAIGAPRLYADSVLWAVIQADSTASGNLSLGLDVINGQDLRMARGAGGAQRCGSRGAAGRARGPLRRDGGPDPRPPAGLRAARRFGNLRELVHL